MAIRSFNKTEFIRVEKDRNYTTINNTCLRDERLSWKAKGIMAYILTLPDDWNIHLEELIKHAPCGEKAFRSGFNELKEFGYVERVQIRDDETKKIVGWHTIVSEIPRNVDNTLLAQNLHVGKLHVDNLHVGNAGLLSTNNTNNLKELSTEKDNVQSEIERDFEEFWKLYPNKKAKKTALVSYMKIIKAGKYNHEHIMNGLMLYLDYIKATNTQSSFIAHPTTYLNQERFNDELVIPTKQYKEQKTFRFGGIANEQAGNWSDIGSNGHVLPKQIEGY